MALTWDKSYLREHGAFDPLDIEWGPVYLLAEGASQTLYPSGFDSAAFGAAAAKWPQDIYPAGIASAGAFGAPGLTARYTRDHDFTLPYGAWNKVHLFGGVVGAQYILPRGWDVLTAGWAPYVSWRQYITPTGFSTVEFGVPSWRERFSRHHDFTDAYSPPLGDAVNHSFGTGAPEILPGGWSVTAFGTTFVQTMPAIIMAGINAVVFGSATVYKQQFVNPTGLDAQVFGATFLENQNRDFNFTGFDSAAFGTAALTRTNYTQTIVQTGADYSRIGAQLVKRGLQAEPAGIDSVAFGGTDISLKNRTVRPFSVDPAYPDVGLPTVTNFYQYESLWGWNSAAFGETDVRNYQPMPTGFDSAAFGATYVANFRQIVAPLGVIDPPFSFDRPVVSNWIRYLPPLGINAAAVGAHRISNFRRYLPPASIAPPALAPFHWVSHYTRSVGPTGFDAAVVWNDYGPLDPVTGRAAGVYNETSYLLPTGVDAAAFGSPAVVRQQVPADWTKRVRFGDYWGLDAIGFDAAALGTAVVAGGSASLVATGFDSAALGATQVNQRVTLTGFDVVAFGTGQINQNLNATGFDAVVFGTTQFDQRLYTTGFDSVQFGTALLSATVSPAGWDSLDMRTWYAAEDYFAEDYHDPTYAVIVEHT